MPQGVRPAPQPLPIPDEAVAVLELPTGDPGRDATAMYRSLFHRRPVANGWTGYRPTSAVALAKVDAGDVRALDTWTRYGVTPDWTTLADDQVMRREMREQLITALTRLPEVYRTPVLLRDIQGMSTEEASQVLHVKPQTLKSRLHRGRLILRQALAEFAGGVALHAREAVN